MAHLNPRYRIDGPGDCAPNNDENVDVANIDVQVDNVPVVENQMVKTCKKNKIKIIVMIVLAIVLGSVITIYFYENNMDKLRC